MDGELVYRAFISGVAVIPKPALSGHGYARGGDRGRGSRKGDVSTYHDQQGDISNDFALLALPFKKQGATFPFDFPVSISFLAKYKDRRRRDLKNILAALEDALVKSGILADDNWKCIGELRKCRAIHGAGEDQVVVELRRME